MMGLSTSTTICNILFLSIGFLWSCNGDNNSYNNNDDASSVHVHVKAKNIRRRTRYIPRVIVGLSSNSNYVEMVPLTLQQQDNDNDTPVLLEADVHSLFFSMDTSLPEPTSMPTKSVEKPIAEVPNSPEEPPTREDRDLLIQTKCDTTAIERSRDILSELLTVSNSSSLINPETSQFKARDWLDNIDSAIICPEESERIHQRYRLALLYYQLGGDQWTRCSSQEKHTSSLLSLPVSSKIDDDDDDYEEEKCPENPWLGAGNECQWYGMSCSGDDATSNDDDDNEYRPLEVLNLQSNNLSGELFDELYGFQQLEKLLLDGNDQITGTISEEVGNLINLTVLQLQSNLIDGPIPEEGLLLLEQLAELSIQDNQLVGSLEKLCDVRDNRRLQFEADCLGESPKVTCSCCSCF